MKIAITARGKTLEDAVDPRFGRSPYFVVVDTDTAAVEAIENPNVALGGGAGIQAAQMMAERDVKAVLTGNCGPNAYQTLEAAGIELIVGVSGIVGEVVERYKAGGLNAAQEANVASHFGMGGGGAMGAGMGMGRGMGRGMGMGRAAATGPMPGAAAEGGDTVGSLKAQAEQLGGQLQAINDRIASLQSGGAPGRLLAVVDAEACTACGLCANVCPVDAITVDTCAAVDAALCTGCGRCVAECPQDALTLKKR